MTLEEIEVYTPRSLLEALRLKAEKRENAEIIAGGTDLLIQLRDREKFPKALINIYRLKELSYIRFEDNELRIGAATSFSEIAESSLVKKYAPILLEAVKQIGSPQIMNKGTIGGNIGNASPAGDSIPPLYVLNASIIVQSIKEKREVPVEDFFLDYKKIDLREDELITEIRIPAMREDEDGLFIKFGLRLGDAISVVNTAIWVKREEWNLFRDIRIALGSVAPTVKRARKSEELLKSSRLNEELMWEAAELVRDEISPITDIRGSAEYRRELAVNLVFKGLWELVYGRVRE